MILHRVVINRCLLVVFFFSFLFPLLLLLLLLFSLSPEQSN